MSTLRAAFAAFFALALMLGFASSASAAPPWTGEQILREIVTSNHPERVKSRLNAAERTLAQKAFEEHLVVTKAHTSDRRALSKAQAQRMGLDTSAYASGGCWYDYEYSNLTLFGVRAGAMWMRLNWCGSGGRITSYYASNVGGAGYNGVSYDGYNGVYYRNAGWEVRAAASYKYSLGWASTSRCGQIRGGATGLYSTRLTCNLN